MNKERFPDKYAVEEQKENLRGADLSNMSLVDAKLSNADLYGANLTNVDLSDADLYGANLYNAKLTNANLNGVDLRVSDLTNVDFRRVDLTKADIRGAVGLDMKKMGSIHKGASRIGKAGSKDYGKVFNG